MKIATLGIITREGKVLLGLKRSGEIGVGTLNGPGGKMEQADKTILDCLIRETREEVGITLDPEQVEKVAVITFYAGHERDFQVHVYRTSSFSGEPHETESMVPAWYDIDDLSSTQVREHMLESDREWFPSAVSGEKFYANVYYLERAKGFIGIEFLPFAE